LRGQDLNLRPSGYEPDELPDCSTPRPAKQERDYNRKIAFMTSKLQQKGELFSSNQWETPTAYEHEKELLGSAIKAWAN
jgi:hypothetical protein